jgi:hypothetical protein
MPAKTERPPWYVNPRSKSAYTSPDVIAAYKARTLHIIELTFPTYVGYAFAVDAAKAAEAVAGQSARWPKAVVTARPYPFEA